MNKLVSLTLTSTLLASMAMVQPALADDWRWHGDIHHFHDHDFDHWRAGRWFNGFHEGRHGWWWIVDGLWYFYPAPIYPYPDPYTPPTVVVETAPVSPTGAAPSYVYYCANPAGYYPYVPQCSGAWQRVASAPAPAMPPMAAPAPQQVLAPPISAPAGSQREADDRQLNAFAVAFQDIDLTGKRAPTKLRNLEKRVDGFRQSLYQRNYNAMDIMKNAEDLQHRITAQREALAKHKGSGQNAVPSVPPPATDMNPAPTSLPPGTAVTFPPQ